MADSKKSFILYCDIIHTFEELEDDEAGRLIKHLLRYVNDLDPVADDKLTKIAFEPIKQQLKRDLKEWDIIKSDRSNAGKLGNLKRWNRDIYDKVVNEEITISEAIIIAKHRKESQSDNFIANVAVNVTDNVTVNNKENTLAVYNNGLSKYLKDEFEERKVTEIQEQKYFDMVVKEMNSVWMKWKPQYSFLQEADYPALLKIAYLIASRKKISKYEAVNIKEDEIVKSFERIAEFMANTESKFLKKLALSGIANPKNFQSIEEEMRTMKQSDKQQQLEQERILPEEYFTK
jgi:hypothetical protein